MKNILVLGATSGIAIPCMRLWAERGDSLLLCGRNSEKLKSVEDDLVSRGAASCQSFACDLGDVSSHDTLFKKIESDFADCDTVFLAYGLLGDQKECEQSFDKTLDSLQVNFISAVSLLTYFANKFEEKGAGSINVITSVAGDRGRKTNYVYGTGKGAMSLFLQGLRNRLCSSGVNVLTIKPGFVATQMTEHLKKGPLFAEPDSIAPSIVRAIDKEKEVIYVPWFWQIIMMVFCLIPEKIFKKLSL